MKGKLKLENGKELVVEFDEGQLKEEETIIPKEVADHTGGIYYLRNVYGDNTICIYRKDSHMKVSECFEFEEEPTIKMVKVKSVKDIKPGDIVRYADNEVFERDNKKRDYYLMIVDRVEGDEIYYCHWDVITELPMSNYTGFGCWKCWEKGVPIKEGVVNDG
jgi:hypothetical protein